MQPLLPVGPDDHTLGPADAPVTLVEYGSYDCSHCRNAAQTVRALQVEFGGQIRRVFRHFPRVTAHSPSVLAAEAAEVAAAQGKFWQMHEALLARRDTLSDTVLLASAAAVGLDLPRFLRDVEANTYRERVDRDFRSGVESGVVSTPTYFINGIRHEDVADITVLRAAITASLLPQSGEVEKTRTTFVTGAKCTGGMPVEDQLFPHFRDDFGVPPSRRREGREDSCGE